MVINWVSNSFRRTRGLHYPPYHYFACTQLSLSHIIYVINTLTRTRLFHPCFSISWITRTTYIFQCSLIPRLFPSRQVKKLIHSFHAFSLFSLSAVILGEDGNRFNVTRALAVCTEVTSLSQLIREIRKWYTSEKREDYCRSEGLGFFLFINFSFDATGAERSKSHNRNNCDATRFLWQQMTQGWCF